MPYLARMRFSDWADDPRKSRRWQRFRRSMLSKWPVCERCGYRVATEVHHLESVRLRRDLAFVEEACRCLCHGCHVEAHKAGRIPLSYRPRKGQTPPYA